MNRRESQFSTPMQNNDALERSQRRQNANMSRETLYDTSLRIQDSPAGRMPISSSGSQLSAAAQEDFQEWMKMIRLKRVKANNAFAIPLIDAFHDMVQGDVLSQDGNSVSFQQATHTLGGCLTVYKSRIARVKDDTSKLLVGVSNKNQAEAQEEVESDGEEANQEKRPTRKFRQHEDCLIPPEKLEIDTEELATTIDPLLRKMSADFDKRGPSSLLQYNLRTGSDGRIILFDDRDGSSANTNSNTNTNTNDSTNDNTNVSSRLPTVKEELEEEKQLNSSEPKFEFDLAKLNVDFFQNVLSHRDLETLPLIDGIKNAVDDPQTGVEPLVRDMQAWALADPGNDSTYDFGENELGMGGDDYDNDNNDYDNNNNDFDHNDNNDELLAGLGLDMNIQNQDMDDSFGNNNNNNNNLGNDDPNLDFDASMPNSSIANMVSTQMPPAGNWLDVNYLQNLEREGPHQFGPSSWKVNRLQARLNANKDQEAHPKRRLMATHAPETIDFDDGKDIDIDSLFMPSNKSNLLSEKSFNTANFHTLPDYIDVTISSFTSLYLRPNGGPAPAFRRMAVNNQSRSDRDGPDYSVLTAENSYGNITLGDMDDADLGGIDNLDDNVDMNLNLDLDLDLNDQDLQSRPVTASQFFSQPFSQRQNEGQLAFARVAKRVDVRKLKDNVYNAITSKKEDTSLIQVIRETQPLYSEQDKESLSPAMYFISMLHLCNERGFTLGRTEDLTDVIISHTPEGIKQT